MMHKYTNDRLYVFYTCVSINSVIKWTSKGVVTMASKYGNPRGKAANAAFAATGAFVFGGQLAFVSSVSTGNVVAAYVACKLVGGILAVWLAMHFTKGDELPAERATEATPVCK